VRCTRGSPRTSTGSPLNTVSPTFFSSLLWPFLVDFVENVKVLSLDISSSTGWAWLDTEIGPGSLIYGCIQLEKKAREYGKHPYGFKHAAEDMASRLKALSEQHPSDVIVIEETNGGGRARFTQKYLEYLHFATLNTLPEDGRIVYVSTSDWRKVTETHLSKEDKNRNAKLSRHKKNASLRGTKLDKKSLGIAGKTTIKHVAIRRVRELYGIELLKTQDDPADAILLLHSFINGVRPCTGSEKER